MVFYVGPHCSARSMTSGATVTKPLAPAYEGCEGTVLYLVYLEKISDVRYLSFPRFDTVSARNPKAIMSHFSAKYFILFFEVG